MKLKRDLVKYVRDKAKSKYKKQSSCYICESNIDLDFHHYYGLTELLETWLKKQKYIIENEQDILALRKSFIDDNWEKVDNYTGDPKKIPINTWSRKLTIIPDFVGVSFLIYNGKKFIPITISEDMVGHKLGEFSPTRTFFGHTPADKKAKPAEVKK